MKKVANESFFSCSIEFSIDVSFSSINGSFSELFEALKEQSLYMEAVTL